MGKEIYVDDEAFIDMSTSISGSGPAYVFLLIEAMVDAAVAGKGLRIGWKAGGGRVLDKWWRCGLEGYDQGVRSGRACTRC